MNLSIEVTAGAKKNLYQEENGIIKVYLTAPAVDDKANKALVKFLAGHFKVNNSAVQILQGLKSRNKLVEIAKF